MDVRIGDPRLPPRFWAKVEPVTSGCWEWRAFKNSKGYGMFRVNNEEVRFAHRVALIAALGRDEFDKETDHLCRNHGCVNPAHLEFVTTRVNQHRSPITNATKTHCKQGHPFDAENTGTYYKSRVGRVCITCRRAKIREYCRRYDPKRDRKRKNEIARASYHRRKLVRT